MDFSLCFTDSLINFVSDLNGGFCYKETQSGTRERENVNLPSVLIA